MRIFLIIIGALIGAVLASESRGWFGALLGAFAVFGLYELIALRRRANGLEQELATLHKANAFRQAAPAAGDARESQAIDETAAERPQRAVERAPIASAHVSDGDVPYVARRAPSAEVSAATAASAEPQPASPGSRPASADPSAARAEQPRPASTRRPVNLPPENPIFLAIREYFTGGNTLVRVGIVILFIGVAFLLRYVAEHTHVPIQLRLSGVAAAGVVLLALGWRLRHKRPGYALALQGGAIGILYLTVFASLRLFSVMTPGPAFALLVLLSAFSVVLGVMQNSLAFSLLAVGCGFLAPILASSGQGNHVVLFSYYGVLNLVIIGIAWFKAWRPLNVAGFLFTFVIGTAWGVLKYKPQFLSSTEPFLIAFFLLYVAIAVLFSLRQKPVLRGYVDGTIVFGVPAVSNPCSDTGPLSDC